MRRKGKYIALSNLVFIIHGKIQKKSYKNDKFKTSAPTWNEEYELPDGSYSVSDFNILFWIYIQKAWGKTVNPSIKIFINKIENTITFKIKTEYYLELLNPETVKLLGSTKSYKSIKNSLKK